jgi:crotonobetainyl-CoA:carnitine CoA-transferase CaiB-like acyl-CoA transferase
MSMSVATVSPAVFSSESALIPTHDQEVTMGMLSGMRVLDLSMRLPGPFCTLMLADHGADVILVTPPGQESMNPFTGEPPGLSAYERYLNRGKRSLSLNLKLPAGREVFMRLAATADVVVEGFRPGVAARLGVDSETLRTAFPSLIYCSISGYGQDDPRARLAGHDIDYLAWSGVLGLNGVSGGAPVPLPVQAGDIFGGSMMAVTAILMALFARQRTGSGATLDVPMTDGAMTLLALQAPHQLAGDGPQPSRGEMPLSGAFPCYDLYRCGDGGYLAVGALEPVFWGRLMEALNLTELAWGQFATGEDGLLVRESVTSALAARSRDNWMEILGPVDCCVAPVLSLDEALNHPIARSRGMIVNVPSPLGGHDRQLGVPFLCDGARPTPSAAPRMGQHSDGILQSLGYDAAAIQVLRHDEVTG